MTSRRKEGLWGFGISSIWLLYVITELHWSVRAAGLVYGLSLAGGVMGSMLAKRVEFESDANKQAIKGTKYSDGQTTDHSSSIVTVAGNLEDALAAPLVTLAGDTGSTQVNSTDLWCNNKS